ncbi:MAG TPA: pyrimidine 5'-nucleotidase [Candidatus Xenobia bacterium]|jgi:putative hydrolase of the HAD superfamily
MNWLFDLDDTLYSASTEFFAIVSKRITTHIAAELNLPWDEARALQRTYWRQYGTSLRGLVLHHGLDPEAFFAAVHQGVPVEEHLVADAQVRDMLLRLPGRRFVFTNSPQEYAHRILSTLHLGDLFEQVFDVRAAGLVPKPDPQAYQRVLEAIGCEGSTCLMVDDNPQNLVTARRLGMRTVWLNSLASEAGQAVAQGERLVEEDEAAHLTIGSLLELEGAVRRASWL